MQRILSGVQPTGNLHLGNYLGAIRNWVALQQTYESLFCIVDLHAITVPQDPEKLRAAVYETAAAFIACGVDPKKSAIFPQSAISAHSELAWILSCHTPLGWLKRMTQFKEKAGIIDIEREKLILNEKSKKMLKRLDSLKEELIKTQTITKDFFSEMKENLELLIETITVDGQIQKKEWDINLGLLSYPVLMAADILVYKATHVPVGEDQKQHLELCRDIAGAFNRAYGKEVFPIPEPLILGEAARVMSLRDGTKKMSKSDESDYSRINLTDDADAITQKIKKAKSDMVEGDIRFDEARPEANNLLTIYAALRAMNKEQAEAAVAGMNFSAFKKELTDVAVSHLAPITQKMRELLAAPDYIDKVLAEGASRAGGIAASTMKDVKQVVGFLQSEG